MILDVSLRVNGTDTMRNALRPLQAGRSGVEDQILDWVLGLPIKKGKHEHTMITEIWCVVMNGEIPRMSIV